MVGNVLTACHKSLAPLSRVWQRTATPQIEHMGGSDAVMAELPFE